MIDDETGAFEAVEEPTMTRALCALAFLRVIERPAGSTRGPRRTMIRSVGVLDGDENLVATLATAIGIDRSRKNLPPRIENPGLRRDEGAIRGLERLDGGQERRGPPRRRLRGAG
jgi:hypothetical protein